MRYFNDSDLQNLWKISEYSQKEYEGEYPTDDMIHEIEKALGGYRLPKSYIELMRIQNGGLLQRDFFQMVDDSVFADSTVWITGIFGIGTEKRYSLGGELGSQFMMDEWGYPNIGICFADTPSAGHEMYMFDYRECGKEGEPAVVHVDQEGNYDITFIAPNFVAFIRGLITEQQAYPDE